MGNRASTYKVHIRSKPGMYEQYCFTVSVTAQDEQDAVEKAHGYLQKYFPDRNREMWILEGIEKWF